MTMVIDGANASVLFTAAHPDIADAVGKSFQYALRVSREGDNDFKVRSDENAVLHDALLCLA